MAEYPKTNDNEAALLKKIAINTADILSGGLGGGSWGSITGLISDQTDLQTELDLKADQSALAAHTGNTSNPHSVTKTQVGLGNVDNTSDANKPVSTATQTQLDLKVDENAAIVGATKTKITYDTKGLVTAGADATTADIADSSNKRYVTDANLTVIGNTSGTNTGDQNLFSSVVVSGQTTVTTASPTQALTLVAGTGVTITTDNTAKSVTINSTATGLALDTATLSTDDTKAGLTLAGLLAGATIAQWEAVYIDGSSTYQLADANGTNTYPARGLAVAAYSSTNAAIILREGIVRNDAWNWTPGGTIYISGTPGGLTQTAPATSGDKIQQVGFALTADIAYFNFASGEYITVP